MIFGRSYNCQQKSPINSGSPVLFDPCASLHSRAEVLISVSFKEVERPLQVKPWDTNFEVRQPAAAAGQPGRLEISLTISLRISAPFLMVI